jgi:transposase
MSGFIQGADRNQGYLLPERIDEYVSEDNPVRVIEAFVEELDLARLGFTRLEPNATGRPAYHPATLLKIYLYGYLNRIQSSRRLEQEANRNLELMWLTGRLAPDFKTLADFRVDNGAGIRGVCREFIVLSATRYVHAGSRGDRRQQVQGGQPSGPELHEREDEAADGVDRTEHQRVPGAARSDGPKGSTTLGA